MKKLIVLILISISNTFFCQGQNSLKEDPIFVATLPKMNILYLGVDNLIDIYTNIDSGVTITIRNGEITQRLESENGILLSVLPNKIGNLEITFNTNEQYTVYNFQVKDMPRPEIAYLKAIMSNFDTSKIKGLYVEQIIAPFDIGYKVNDFFITKISKGISTTIKNKGNLFSKETLKLITKTNKGDMFIFSNVLCTDHQNLIVQAHDFVINIVK